MFFSPLQIQVRVNWAPPSKCWSGFGWRSVIFCSLSGYIFGYLQVGWNAVFKVSRHEELGLGLSRENTVRRQSANVLRGCNLCQSRMLGLENILVKQPCIHFFSLYYDQTTLTTIHFPLPLLSLLLLRVDPVDEVVSLIYSAAFAAKKTPDNSILTFICHAKCFGKNRLVFV